MKFFAIVGGGLIGAVAGYFVASLWRAIGSIRRAIYAESTESL
jgi:hypothetical protein